MSKQKAVFSKRRLKNLKSFSPSALKYIKFLCGEFPVHVKTKNLISSINFNLIRTKPKTKLVSEKEKELTVCGLYGGTLNY